MESQRIQDGLVDGGQCLDGAAVVKFVERIVRSLHAAVEEVAGIGGLTEIGDLGVAAVGREIGGRRRIAAGKQARADAGEAKEVEHVRLRAIGHAAHRVRELMQGHADQKVRIDVGGKRRAAVVGRGVVGAEKAPQLQLRVPDRDSRTGPGSTSRSATR